MDSSLLSVVVVEDRFLRKVVDSEAQIRDFGSNGMEWSRGGAELHCASKNIHKIIVMFQITFGLQ